jgi:hypothetical protein
MPVRYNENGGHDSENDSADSVGYAGHPKAKESNRR